MNGAQLHSPSHRGRMSKLVSRLKLIASRMSVLFVYRDATMVRSNMTPVNGTVGNRPCVFWYLSTQGAINSLPY